MNMIQDALAARFPTEESDASLDNLTGVLAEWRKTGMIGPFLREIHDDSDALRTAAQKAYRHDNGFWKILIGQAGAVKLRLHIWPKQTSDFYNDPNIHNHRWDFSSLLLCGSYRQQIYSVSNDPATKISVSHFHYHPQGSASMADHDYLTFVEEASLQKVQDEVWRSPQTIAVSVQTLHRTTVEDNLMVASLFLQGPDRRRFTDVYSEGAPARIKPGRDRVISAAELTQALSKVLDTL